MNPIPKFVPIGVHEKFIQSYEAAKMISGSSIQNCKVGVVGSTGKGKSELVQSLGVGVAEEKSIIEYREPDRWEEFYPYEENMAIITSDDMIRVATKKAPGQVKTFDEIQEKANNSRDFRSNLNRLFNQLFILKRPERNCIITDAQWVSMLDRQSRYMYHFYNEMMPMNSFEDGLATCKVKYVNLRAMDEKEPARYPYPLFNGVQYQLCASLLAPKKVRNFYKKHRDECEKIAEEERLEEEKKEQQMKEAKFNRAIRENANDAVTKYLEDHTEATSEEISEALSIAPTTVRSTYSWRHRD
jgi:energy-coupling factor transporter ATP-binding protein EcfA2